MDGGTAAIFSSRLNLIQFNELGTAQTVVGVEGPIRVARAGAGDRGDLVTGFGRLRGLAVADAVNTNGIIAFWAATDGGVQAILKASRNRMSMLPPTAANLSPAVKKTRAAFAAKVNARDRFDPDSPLVEYVMPGVPGNSRRKATNQLILHAPVGNKVNSLIALADKSEKSIHYLVTRDGQVIQVLQEKDVANHAANAGHFAGVEQTNANPYSIGIELVDDFEPKNDRPDGKPGTGHRLNANWFTPIQEAKAALLVRDICRRNGIPMSLPEPLPAEFYSGGDRRAWQKFKSGITGTIDPEFTAGSGNPKLNPDKATMVPGTNVTIAVTANDIDPDDKPLTVVWSKNSCGLSVVEFQEAAEALASLDVPCPFTDPIRGRGKQDHVALAWVISLRVEMIHVIFKEVAERAFSEKNHFRQELGLYGSNRILRHQILVAQEEFLIHRTGEGRQHSFPIHRRDLTEPFA